MGQPHRLRPGEVQPVRRVTQLHPKVEVELTPSAITHYRSLGRRWAIVYDRQSQKKVLTQEEKTGQENRVRNVLTMARDLGLTLPTPTENPDRDDGEFQFAFEAEPVCYHWFVDGMKVDASGFTASPYARRRLWELAKTIQRLREYECHPQALLIGELTRFFRDQAQFMDWYFRLKSCGVAIRIYGCPELNPDTEGMMLPMLLCQTDALSKWLGKNWRDSRETRRSRKELWNTVAPFLLEFDLDPNSPGYRRVVRANPAEWAIIQELIRRLLRGEFNGSNDAMAWLVDEQERRGIPRERRVGSPRWLQDLFKSDLLAGLYCQYSAKSIACRIEDEEMHSDWDMLPSGRRRYWVEETPEKAVPFPIQLEEHQKILPEDLARAREILTQRGRPRKKPADEYTPEPRRQECNALTLFRFGILRCAHCGAVVDEHNPRITYGRERIRMNRIQDEYLVQRLAEGASNAQIAAELTALSPEHAGEHFEIKDHRLRDRKHRLQLYGSCEENLAKVAAFWEDPFAYRPGYWHLYCTGVRSLSRSHEGRNGRRGKGAITVEQAREIIQRENPHPMHRNGSVSLALEPLLCEAAAQDPRIRIGAARPLDQARRATITAALLRVEQEIQRVQDGFKIGIYNQVEALKEITELRAEQARLTAENDTLALDLLAANDLADIHDQQRIQAEIKAILHHPKFKASVEFRREFVSLAVARVEVDLATGEFVAQTRFFGEALRQLRGRLQLTETLTQVDFQNGTEGTSGRPSGTRSSSKRSPLRRSAPGSPRSAASCAGRTR
jgi:uncharacterized protein (DUF433 family)